ASSLCSESLQLCVRKIYNLCHSKTGAYSNSLIPSRCECKKYRHARLPSRLAVPLQLRENLFKETNMKYVSLGVFLFCLLCANVANADAIYDFSLPANGSVSSFDVELTFPDLLPADGLLVINLTSPQVTSLSFATAGFTPSNSVIGLEITPTSTLFGV